MNGPSDVRGFSTPQARGRSRQRLDVGRASLRRSRSAEPGADVATRERMSQQQEVARHVVEEQSPVQRAQALEEMGNVLNERKQHEDRVRVFVRVRPLSAEEQRQHGGLEAVRVIDEHVVRLTRGPDDVHEFNTFDRVMGPHTSQEEVFVEVAPMVDRLLSGYNCSIIAYGQTSAGKTFTMMGLTSESATSAMPTADVRALEERNRGVIPRMVEGIFDRIHELEMDEEGQFEVSISYLEVYAEQLYDLFRSPAEEATYRALLARGRLSREERELLRTYKLSIIQQPDSSILIQNAVSRRVFTATDALHAMREGNANRMVAATAQNKESSRSHAIFLLTVIRKVEGHTTVSQLYLVDLAGSERVSKTRVARGIRLEEAKSINQSLFTLGRVISALSKAQKGGKKVHIPYRSSLLTRMLQNSLGGNASTAMIIAVSPSTYNADESLSSLRFGDKSRITNKVTVNAHRSAGELMLLLESANATIAEQAAQLAHLQALVSRYQRMDPLVRLGGDGGKGKGEAVDGDGDGGNGVHGDGVLADGAVVTPQPPTAVAPVSAPSPSPHVTEDWVKLAQTDFRCSITGAFLTHPVVASDGHTYERAAIEEWIQRNGLRSPVVWGAPLPSPALVDNRRARAQLRRYADAVAFWVRSGAVSLDHQPTDVLRMCFTRCSAASLCACALVCRRWNAILSDDFVWIALLRRDFDHAYVAHAAPSTPPRSARAFYRMMWERRHGRRAPPQYRSRGPVTLVKLDRS